ncbi:hypothetical protein HZC32_03370 [Candidatus Woesearchaeota archaeon]|nr:hypothetical protein [Candidatus Woesearchaeota archaeon]
MWDRNLGKKGQVTVFIILGILIFALFVVALYLLSNSQNQKLEEKTYFGATPIVQFVESCIQQSIKKAITLNAIQGGFNDIRYDKDKQELLSIPYTIFSHDNYIPFYVPFYVESSVFLAPSEKEIELQFSKRIKPLISECLDFSKLEPSYEIEAQTEKINVSTEIVSETITVNLFYPLTIKEKEDVKEMYFFKESVKTVYPVLYQAAIEYSELQSVKENEVCLSCMQEIADKYNLMLQYAEFENYGDIIFNKNKEVTTNTEILANHTAMLVYHLSKEDFGGKNLTFIFVHLFDIHDEYAHPENNFESKILPVLEAEVGAEFTYPIMTVEEEMTYFDDTDLFEIGHDTGLIKFIPKEADVGEHIIKIMAVDKQKKIKKGYFVLKIKKLEKPVIDPIDYLNAIVGEEFTYQVKANEEDAKLSYFDDTNLFETNKENGSIIFTPKKEQVGEYLINISVFDEKGNLNTVEMALIIDDKYTEK